MTSGGGLHELNRDVIKWDPRQAVRNCTRGGRRYQSEKKERQAAQIRRDGLCKELPYEKTRNVAMGGRELHARTGRWVSTRYSRETHRGVILGHQAGGARTRGSRIELWDEGGPQPHRTVYGMRMSFEKERSAT